MTHGDVAVRLDLVDPETLLHQAAGSTQQLFELAQREGPHLEDATEKVSHSHGDIMTTQHSSDLSTVALVPSVTQKIILITVE